MEQDDPLTKEKMRYAYRRRDPGPAFPPPPPTPLLPSTHSYGIKMFMAEMVTQEQLQEVVLEKLASRVNMDGAALDKWLEVPAVV